MKIDNFCFLIVILFLGVAYGLGYYFGKKDGVNKGLLIAPIIFRKKSLEQGHCILCNKDKSNKSLQVKSEKM